MERIKLFTVHLLHFYLSSTTEQTVDVWSLKSRAFRHFHLLWFHELAWWVQVFLSLQPCHKVLWYIMIFTLNVPAHIQMVETVMQCERQPDLSDAHPHTLLHTHCWLRLWELFGVQFLARGDSNMQRTFPLISWQPNLPPEPHDHGGLLNMASAASHPLCTSLH